MARQASSSIGGIVGALVGVVIIGALVATPFYITTLESDRAKLHSEMQDSVKTVRHAVANMDEHLVRIANLSKEAEAFGELPADVTIPKERLDELQRMSQELRRTESNDSERGTEIESQRIQAPGGANRSSAQIVQKLKAEIAKHDKLMNKAQQALRQLQTASAGTLQGGSSLEGARIKAIFEYASGRVAANHAAFFNWRAQEALADASPLVGQLAQLKNLHNSIAMESPVDVSKSINEKIQNIESEKSATQAKLDQIQGTIDDYNARIDQLDATSRTNRLKMAEMQTRSERIDQPSSQYAQLAAEARQAEAQSDALRFGTLQDGTAMRANPSDLVPTKYEGGTPVIGLFALTEMADNLREQIANLDSAHKALEEQRRHFDAEEASVQASTEEAVTDAESLAKTIQDIIADAKKFQTDSNKASDEAVKHLSTAVTAARSAANAAGNWKREMTIEDAPAESPAAEFNALIRTDGHTQGSMQFLEGECAYQVAVVRYDQIQLANAIHDVVNRAAELSQAEPEAMPGEAIDAWRSEALTQLAKAQTAYNNAGKSFVTTQATLAGRTIQGKDTVWQAQAGEAAVHLLRAVLKTDSAERKAEKDAAYDLLKEAAKGRERSPLLTPTVDMILELQANPS